MKAHFNALRNSGCTVSQVSKAIKVAKAIFTYAFDLEYVTSNVMQRFPKLQRVDGERTANRGVFTEAELKAIFANATAFELGLVATLSISGPRPGEIYALDWSAVYLDVEKPLLPHATAQRAEIPYRDMYSLCWTSVSMARASGDAAFNVSRLIGHARARSSTRSMLTGSTLGWPEWAKVSSSGSG